MWHSLRHCCLEQLLTNHYTYPIPGFFVSSSYPLKELQISPYLKNLLLFGLNPHSGLMQLL